MVSVVTGSVFKAMVMMVPVPKTLVPGVAAAAMPSGMAANMAAISTIEIIFFRFHFFIPFNISLATGGDLDFRLVAKRWYIPT